MYCLDTNIIVDYLRGDEKVIEKVKKLVETSDIFVTTITFCELYKGIHLSHRAQRELFVLDNFAQSVKIIDLNLPICRKFGERFAFLREKGKMIEDFDLMISTIAAANDLTLVTRDKKHFENTGVRLEIW